jgi:hypothetical protein
MDRRCDEVTNCDDSSDESDCAMLDFDINQYRHNYPPVSNDNVKLNVEVGVKVLALGNIQDILMKFGSKFQLSLRWFDKRLTYKNLKPG